MKNIGVFCSSLDCKKVFTDQANELGRIIGNKNYNLVFGGGKLGLMGVLAESAKKMDLKLYLLFLNTLISQILFSINPIQFIKLITCSIGKN